MGPGAGRAWIIVTQNNQVGAQVDWNWIARFNVGISSIGATVTLSSSNAQIGFPISHHFIDSPSSSNSIEQNHFSLTQFAWSIIAFAEFKWRPSSVWPEGYRSGECARYGTP